MFKESSFKVFHASSKKWALVFNHCFFHSPNHMKNFDIEEGFYLDTLNLKNFTNSNYQPRKATNVSFWSQLKNKRCCWIVLDFKNVVTHNTDLLFIKEIQLRYIQKVLNISICL